LSEIVAFYVENSAFNTTASYKRIAKRGEVNYGRDFRTIPFFIMRFGDFCSM